VSNLFLLGDIFGQNLSRAADPDAIQTAGTMSLFRALKSRPLFNSAGAPRLQLYDMRYCYYCAMVRDAADRMNFHLELIDVLKDRDARQKLQDRFGRSTVPVLAVLDDKGETLIPESRDIVRYLQKLDAERNAKLPS
jgi:glutaredoxin